MVLRVGTYILYNNNARQLYGSGGKKNPNNYYHQGGNTKNSILSCSLHGRLEEK